MNRLEVVQRTCGWCGNTTREVEREGCRTCGGPLPGLPPALLERSGLSGPALLPAPPPPPPRVLPAAYLRRLRFTGNVEVILGAAFTIFFCWTLIFPLIGIPLWLYGSRRAERKIRALQHGVGAEGTLLAVNLDTSTTVNGQHPWRLRYVFETPRGTFEGACQAWDPLTGQRQVGEMVQVVFVPGEEEHVHALWPPVR